MSPAPFPETNCNFVAPSDLDESQVQTVQGYRGKVVVGNLDGAPICVVAWQPTVEEIELIKAGKAIFLTFIGGIPPHYPSMSFEEATKPG